MEVSGTNKNIGNDTAGETQTNEMQNESKARLEEKENTVVKWGLMDTIYHVSLDIQFIPCQRDKVIT